MKIFTRAPRSLLTPLAFVFAVATVLYSGLWIYNARWQLPVELGFEDTYLESGHCELIKLVYSGSPAESAGLKAGDRILKADGREFGDANTLGEIWEKHKPGDTIALVVERAGAPAPLVLQATFRARSKTSNEGGLVRLGHAVINNTFPLAFLAVGLTSHC